MVTPTSLIYGIEFLFGFLVPINFSHKESRLLILFFTSRVNLFKNFSLRVDSNKNNFKNK